jgi:hypothetical protein
VTIELPAVSLNIPVSEYNQLRAQNSNLSDETALASIQKTTDIVVRAVADAIERLRGVVLQTGKATVSGFMDDDFGRAGGHTVSAAAAWSIAATDALADLQSWSDTYNDANGQLPGAIVTSTRVARAMGKLDQFKTVLVGGASRPASLADLSRTVEAESLPTIYLYDRRVQVDGVATKVLSDDRLLLLPEPVDPNDDAGTELGATFWGRTLTSSDPEWGIEDAEQPGLVAGVYRNKKPPMIAEVISDAIALPVLANANLSFAADVL